MDRPNIMDWMFNFCQYNPYYNYTWLNIFLKSFAWFF